MVWTEPPRTWVLDEVIPFGTLNVHLRDQLIILKTPINDDGTLKALVAARTTSNQTWTTDTVLADIAGLSFAIGASEVWEFWALIHYLAPTAADIKFDVTAPSGASGRHGVAGDRVSGSRTSAPIGTVVTNQGIDSVDFATVHSGVIVNSTTPGTVQLQSAQNNSSGTNTIYANSGIKAVQIG